MSTYTPRRIGFERIITSPNRADRFTFEKTSRYGWTVQGVWAKNGRLKRWFLSLDRAYTHYVKMGDDYAAFLDANNVRYTQAEVNLYTGEQLVL